MYSVLYIARSVAFYPTDRPKYRCPLDEHKESRISLSERLLTLLPSGVEVLGEVRFVPLDVREEQPYRSRKPGSRSIHSTLLYVQVVRFQATTVHLPYCNVRVEVECSLFIFQKLKCVYVHLLLGLGFR